MRFFSGVWVVLVLTLGGCRDQSPPPSVQGSWAGTSGNLSFTMTLSQNGTTVSGAGQVTGPGGSAALTVTGTHVHPDVALTLASEGFESFNFSGELEGSKLGGALNGSGFTNRAVTFARK